MEAHVVRDDGTEAEFNEPGELYVRGETLVSGYWNNEKATRELLVNGCLRTGDVFKVNEDGHFFFIDRVKDTFKVNGLQVSPTEIEDVLLRETNQLISKVCVAGVNTGNGAHSDELVPRAWIVLRDAGKAIGGNATIEVLQKRHKEVLGEHQWLSGGIEVVEELPKSSIGKPLRRVLQKEYEQQVKAIKEL